MQEIWIVSVGQYGGWYAYDNREAADEHVDDLGEDEEHKQIAAIHFLKVRKQYEKRD